MTNHAMENCKHCATEIQENYHFCPACGEKVHVERLSVKKVLLELLERYFSWDSLLFKTTWHMISQPEKPIGHYVNGIRKKYMHPMGFMIISLTIYAVFLYFGSDKIEHLFSAQYNFSENEEGAAFMLATFEWINKYFNLITFLTIPLYSALSYYVFRKFRYNFIEHNIIYAYTNAEFNLFSSVISFAGLWFSLEIFSLSQFLVFFVMLIYYPWVFKRVFRLSIRQTILKSLVYMSILGLILIILVILVALGVVFYKLRVENG